MKSAYPNLQEPVEIRLYCNIPFDNTYQHHSLISSQFKVQDNSLYTSLNTNACERFIDRKNIDVTGKPYYYPRYDMTGEFNFDFKNGLIGSVTLELTSEQTNANYLRVKVLMGVHKYVYYYYFITGISQTNFQTYTLSLELDVLMTYQDDFLSGIAGIPVSTARKHSRRFNASGVPHCADFKNSENAFVGINPSITKEKTTLQLKGGMGPLSDASWLYIAYDTTAAHAHYKYKDCLHPVAMYCQPYNCSVILADNNGHTLTLDKRISKLIGDGRVHGAKISPYPPIFDEDATITTETLTDGSKRYTIKSPHLTFYAGLWRWRTSDCEITVPVYESGDEWKISDNIFGLYGFSNSFNKGFKYQYEPITLDIDLFNPIIPSIFVPRVNDARLNFAPFKKYVLTAPYGNEYQFYPELMMGEDGNNVTRTIEFETSATAYIADNNITTYIKQKSNGGKTIYKYYDALNLGLSSSINYSVPAGTDALDVFNTTQANSFYQSKIASGITSGLTIAGGIGSIGLGIAGMLAPDLGLSKIAGVGLIAGGVTALTSGTASEITNAISVNAKQEDLRNTPDSFNVNGSNYTTDYARTGGNMPYVITYECSKIIKETANDLFYNYGYAVARDCYFNTQLHTTYASGTDCLDNNLFGRTIFNYIQLNEDITNKINANIPLIVKQKLSAIFIKGITLWSFFGFNGLWNDTEESTLTNPDFWFMKHTFENAEYNV